MKTTLLIAIIAVLAYSANAYCPNLCSGHGTCQPGDVCECYKYEGTTRGDYGVSSAHNSGVTREAWTGADCSLRTCPLAYSWSGATPTGLTNSATLTDTGTAYTFDAVGDQTQLLANFKPGSKVKVGANLGAATVHTIRTSSFLGTTTTVTFYDVPGTTTNIYYGTEEVETSALAAGGSHALLECGGQGLCDRATGECQCFPGYEGEACARSVCPNNCSNHGDCLASNRLAEDASHTYNQAWDNNKHYGCKCNVGYRGPDCSLQECPSDYDPLYGCGGGTCNTGGGTCANDGVSDCATPGYPHENQQRDCSGRGICDYESGVCMCFAGFYGEACGSQTILI